ncbi:MAG: peptidoglycan editing factor PgeF [Paracoccaceae bacterium]
MLNPVISGLLRDVPHGFFTREGGVSEGIFLGLNGGQGSKDTAEAVVENRRRIKEHLAADALVSVYQVHSPDAVRVDGPWNDDKPDADAMVTDRPGIALGILTADCTPVLFADRTAGVVGAAHAGWKGALGGVLETTLDQMEALGADRGRVVAAIGPVISQRAYEVGPEFVERFLEEDPDWAQFFAGGKGDRAMFDLPGYCLMRLRSAGVGEADWTGHCTYSDEARFYSYRRTCHRGEPDYGRLVAAIMVPASR